MWYLKENGDLDSLMKDIPEAYNMPRQALPATYIQNGNVDLLRPRVVTQYHSMKKSKHTSLRTEASVFQPLEDHSCHISHMPEPSAVPFPVPLCMP